MAKRIKKDKPFNSGTMTESAFWSFIRSALRQKSRFWKPVKEVKDKAKRAYKGNKKRQKWEYQCKECKGWFSEKEIAVDHIKEVGTLNEKTAGEFILSLFCEADGLQVLCNDRLDGKESCHRKKTNKYLETKKQAK